MGNSKPAQVDLSQVPVAELATQLRAIVAEGPRTFGTGSKGFHGQAKLTASDGTRWQAAILAVLIGSKADASMTATASMSDVHSQTRNIAAGAQAKVLNGKPGIYAQGKIVVAVDGGAERYQVSAQAVKIASE